MPDPISPADLLERFRRVLLQEQRLGYRDRGALRGLDRFVAGLGAIVLLTCSSGTGSILTSPLFLREQSARPLRGPQLF